MTESKSERARRRRKERVKREGRKPVEVRDGRVPPHRYLTARTLSDYAHEHRHPGETLIDALKRARRELSALPVEFDDDRSE